MALDCEIPRKEVLRYLGYQGKFEMTPVLDEIITSCIKRLEKESSPKSVTKEFDIKLNDNEVSFGGITIESRALSKNLKGCSKAVIFAVTIGPECDLLARRAALMSGASAAVYQAAGAAAVESCCDKLNQEIIDRYETEGLYARPRFSPGYGDLALEHQTDWFNLLDITRKIGVELTDSLLMVPTKSVTAIIGLSPNNLPCIKQGCEVCKMSKTCAFSRERN